MKRLLLIATCVFLGGLISLAASSLALDSRPTAADKAQPAVIPRELTSYRDIVKRVLPAVVSLEAQAKGGKPRPRRPGDMAFPSDDPIGQLNLHKSPDDLRLVEDERSQVGFGSGFVISVSEQKTGGLRQAIIVTNNHVVEGADQVLVQIGSGKKFTATTIRTDAKTDLAIVKLDLPRGEELPCLEFGDSNAMEIGDRVLAVGAPFGLAGTVTHGIISSKGRALRMNMYEDFLQTDAAINPGNSGGPLVNLEGKVIGITSAIKSRSGGFQGIGLAIASNLGKTITEKLLKDGVVQRGYLGVGIRDVDAEVAKELNLQEVSGVLVTRTYRDAPGEKAGVEKSDVIIALGGKPIKDMRSLQSVVAELPVGKPVELSVLRNGKVKKLRVTIEEQPETFGTSRGSIRVPEPGKGAFALDKIGVVVTDLTDEFADALGYPTTIRGVLLTRVNAKGLAGQAGMQPGSVVLSVDKQPVTNAKAMIKAIADASTSRGIVLQVRGPRTAVTTITLREED